MTSSSQQYRFARYCRSQPRIKSISTLTLMRNGLAAQWLILIAIAAFTASSAYAADRDDILKAGDGKKQYEEFGLAFADTLNNQDLAGLAELYDVEAFARVVAKTVTDKPIEADKFTEGFLSNGKEALLNNMFGAVFQQNAPTKYLRTISWAGSMKPMLRVDIPDGGHEYIVLTTAKNKDGDLVAIDMFLASAGKLSSESIGAASQLLLAPSDSMLSRLLNIKKLDKGMADKFKKIGALRQQGKYQEAYKVYNSFPDDVRTTRVILDIGIGLSQFVNDEEYQKQLGLLAKHHGSDDSTIFMLIDYYFMQQDFDKAFASIDRMIQKFGEDGALYTLKASIAMQANDTAAASRFARDAIRAEPDFIDAYWLLITLLNGSKKYDDMVTIFKSLEDNFGYEFSGENFTDEFYSDFAKSAAYKSWLK